MGVGHLQLIPILPAARTHHWLRLGCPDLVFGSRRKVIFVHGCFWHQHECPRGARPPKSNQDYWLPKLQRNKCRDEKNLILLAELTWRTLVIWECETKDRNALGARIHKFLEE
jgi:DNA mismatch endonuclease, patch repair protein